jgi:hypothetical protein
MWGVDGKVNVILTTAMVVDDFSSSRPCRFIPGVGVPSTDREDVGYAPEPVWKKGRSNIFDPTGTRTPTENGLERG